MTAEEYYPAGSYYSSGNLNIGEEYDLGEDDVGFYKIYEMCDEVWKYYYPKDLFITLEEYRNRKLEEIGI